MSENEKKTEPKTKRRSMTNVEFFKLCEELRNRQEVLLKELPSLDQCATEMTTRLGFTVTRKHIRAASEVTGVIWKEKRKKGSGYKASTQNSSRVLCYALYDLFNRLGEKVPGSLEALYQHNTNSQHGNGGTVEILVPPAPEIKPQTPSTGTNGQLPPAGLCVFKVGDNVYVDGLHTKVQKVVGMSGNGRIATLDNNWEVQVSRLQLALPVKSSRNG